MPLRPYDTRRLSIVREVDAAHVALLVTGLHDACTPHMAASRLTNVLED